MLNLLNETRDSKFVKTQMQIMMQEKKLSIMQVLKSNLCDYNDVYILLRGDVIVKAAPATQVSFKIKNWAPFTKCITKIDGTTIDEDLELVMPMNNLLLF